MTNTTEAENNIITVQTLVDARIEKVWDYFTMPAHITRWNNASDDWHTPQAASDLKEGGKFTYRMEAKDGSFGFDFEGVFDRITPNEYIEYTIADGRKVSIKFAPDGNKTSVVEQFEPEHVNALDIQKTGWQNILDSFKNYTETN